MLHIENTQVPSQPVHTIEGQPNTGTVFVKPLIRGEDMALLEVRMRAGVASCRCTRMLTNPCSTWSAVDSGPR
jgi:hypothetical protein